ncbi:conserved exported hypothetical protein [Candidatus Zixiibacteriota bacterium]|nr:conserved exported hypothetical protein [candidate division Zixibacteria bacterium]
MIKRFVLIFAVGLLFSIIAGPISARDTGTYEILDYRVTLTPSSNGTVRIEYYQKWKVTGGHIPWITVGTSGGDFRIERFGGAATQVSNASQGSWSGVRLDLNQDYREGETFEIDFTLAQNKLFYADKDNYKLDFTPGWYDRAAIDTLDVTVVFFADINTVTAEPKPTNLAGNAMSWRKTDLSRGKKLSISISIPKKIFPVGINQNRLKKEGGGDSGYSPLIIFIFGFIVFFLIVALLSSKKKKYSGGSIFYGGIFGGRGGSSSGGSGGRSTGGGGGFGGGGFSCACACVSCACACACAGGGGAGCSRKETHSCPICRPGRKV